MKNRSMKIKPRKAVIRAGLITVYAHEISMRMTRTISRCFTLIRRSSMKHPCPGGNTRSASGGFTLIEMVVGVAISSIMLLMLYTSYRTTLSIVKRVSGYAEFYENINLAIKKIDSDISNCYFKKEGTAHFICTTVDNNSKLNFVTINHKDISMKGDLKRPNPDCDIKEVGYYLIKDKDYQDINLLIKREQSNYDKDPEGGGEQNIILENVVSLKFNFKQNNDWVDKWDSRQNSLYPEAVKTTLVVKNYEGIVDKYIFISNVNLTINTQGQK